MNVSWHFENSDNFVGWLPDYKKISCYGEYYETSSPGVWDRGLDLIPAGHLAVEQINNRSDILQGYELKHVDEEAR